MTTSSKIMKNIAITLFLIAMSCGIANAQWTKVYQTDSCDCSLGIHVPLAGMAFFGNDTGIVCSAGKGAVTAATLDGGLSWDTITIDPSVLDDIGSPLFGSNSSFLDVNHIWFCNGAAVCHTNNAGKTWVVDTNHDSLGDAKSIYFVDSLVGFEGGEQALMVFRTSDGGKNWSSMKGPLVNDPAGNYGVDQIEFCTPKLGLAICSQLNGLMLRTTDSGMSWALTTDINYVGFGQPVCLSYPDSHNAWYTDGGYILHSSDSGLTWTVVCSEIAPQSPFRSISFVDSLHGIAVASAGLYHTDPIIIGYTSDGGQSWQTSSVDSEANSNICFTSFTDTNTCYAGGFDAVFKLNIQDLAVQATPPVLTGASLESEDGNLFIVMPQSSGGRVRIVDALGRTLEEEILSPAARSELPNGSPSQPQFRFAEVECNGRIQVFKVLN
jgi:photosystem II stability/assembly factor-like uncharacterized protein